MNKRGEENISPVAKKPNKVLIVSLIVIVLLTVGFIIAGFLVYSYFFDEENLPIIPVNNGSNGLINDSNNQDDDDTSVINITNLTDDEQQGPSSSSGSGSGRRPPVNPLVTCTDNCTSLGFECGIQTDNCGNAINCPACSDGELCTDGICATGNVYYISQLDTNCNDSGNGTKEVPWCNISKGIFQDSSMHYMPIRKIPEASTVIIKTGNYGVFGEDGRINGYDPVSRNEWTTYKAATGEKVVFDGITLFSNDASQVSSHLIFKGVEVKGNVVLRRTDDVKILNSFIHKPSYINNDFLISNTLDGYNKNIFIENNIITHGFRGILISGENITVRNNTIYDIAEIGIMGGAKNAIIEKNHVYDVRSSKLPGYGIHNDAIYFNGGDNSVVSGNIVHDFQAQGIAIYNGGQNLTVSNNLVYEITFTTEAGMVIEGSTADMINITIVNNTVFNSRCWFYTAHNYTTIAKNLENNIFSWFGITEDKTRDGEIRYIRIVNHNNNIFGNNPNNTGGPLYRFYTDTNTEVVNYNLSSIFVDAANRNFYPKSDSIACNGTINPVGVAVGALACANSETQPGKTSSITQYGITWTFDKPYEYGTFVNGDYWVVGPLNITRIDPATFVDSNGYHCHGAMVNPAPDGTPNVQIGYGTTDIFTTYNATLNKALGSDGNPVDAGHPLILSTNSSLVSALSYTVADPKPYKSTMKHMAILTVVASAPAANSFRPPYSGTDKVSYFTKDDLDYTKLDTTNAGNGKIGLTHPIKMLDKTMVEEWINGPWIDHFDGKVGPQLHPYEQMPGYGTAVARQYGNAVLMVNLAYTNTEKELLMIRLTQIGIDNYGIVENGGIRLFGPDGGHGPGRKLPILFAGTVLNKTTGAGATKAAAMRAIGAKSGDYLNDAGYGPGNLPPDYIQFGEDDCTFYVNQLDIDITNSAHPTIPWTPSRWPLDATVWTVTYPPGNPNHHGFVTYNSSDIGTPEYGLNHAIYPGYSAKKWNIAGDYRPLNSDKFMIPVMASHIMGLKTLWNHDALFDYTDRYMEIRIGLGDTFEKEMWDKYRKDYGCFWTRDNQTDTYSQGYYDCAGQNIICASGIGGNKCTNNNCVNISVCTDYPNIRAFDYDPCNLGCVGDFDPGQLTSLKANSSSFLSSVMNWFKSILTGNTLKDITGNFFNIFG